MTKTDDLVERLEAHMGKADLQDVLADCREAAARIQSDAAIIEGLRAALKASIPALEQDWQEANDCADAAWCDRAWTNLRAARSLIQSDEGR